MADVETTQEQVEVIQQEVAPVIQQADRFMVASAEQYQDASDFLRQLKSAQKRVKEHFQPMKQAAHKAWKAVCSKETETLEPLDQAEKTVKERMLAWYQEQERKRQEEERRLQAEAEERARKERKRLEKEALRLKTPEKKQERMEQAEQVTAAPVYVERETPKVQGQSVRQRWTATVTDPRAVVQAVMRWPDWEAYIEIKKKELDRFAARTKGQVEIPGIEFRQESTLASSGK